MTEKQTDISLTSLLFPLSTTKVLHFIACIGLVVYGLTFFNGFVWDDLSNILFNSQVHSFNPLIGFEKSNVNQGLQFRPLVTLYFSSLYALFGDMPFFYHVCNVMFHISNSMLVYLLLKHFFKISMAFFLSLIFLVHPMQVESAAWISTAGNLYFFFGMVGLLIGIQKNNSFKWSLVVGILFLLSLFSKETGIVFPLMLILYMIIWKRKNILNIISVATSVVVFYGFLRLFVTQVQFEAPSKIIPIARLSLSERFITIPEVITYYFKTFFYPQDLVIMQYWVIKEIDFQHFFLPLFSICFCILASCLGGYYLYRHAKNTFYVYIYFYIWLLLGIVLHIHISPLNMTVADRWFYFPMIGLLVLLGMLGNVIWEKWGSQRAFPYVVFVASTIIIVLSLRTIIRNADWKDDLTLYLHDRQIQTNFNIENNIGWNYQQQKDWKNAQKYYKNSVDLYPYYAISLNNLAYSYVVLGYQEKGREYFYNVLNAADYYPDAYIKALRFSAWALTQFDTPDNAKDFSQKALQKIQNDSSLLAYLAINEYRLNNQSAAEEAIEKAVTINSSQSLLNLKQLIQSKKALPTDIGQL